MRRKKIALFIFFFLLSVGMFSAQTLKKDYMWDLLNLVRQEKFDFILPKVMRENKVDMWIHVIREGSNDVLSLDLGGYGWFIFTDRGGDRIERAVFGQLSREVQDPEEVYDIIKRPAWEQDLRDFAPEKELKEFVAERDPKRIAVNFSKELAVFDTLSHTDYMRLIKALGNKYAKRLVSDDHLVIDYCARKVISEVVLYTKLCEISAEIIDKAFDMINPGVTTLKDVALWLRNQKIAQNYGCDVDRSLGNVFVRDPYGNEDLANDHVIQGGDLVGIVHGVKIMNYASHISGIAYVLRKGETALPPEVQKIWEHALKTRKIFRKNIKRGRTAGETLEILKRKLEEAGYVYIDMDEYDRSADPEKTQVHIDMHALGRGLLAPRISPFGPDRARDIELPLYHSFAFEYMIHMPVPERGKGKHLYICLHDGVVITEYGVEFPYPPLKKIRLIR